MFGVSSPVKVSILYKVFVCGGTMLEPGFRCTGVLCWASECYSYDEEKRIPCWPAGLEVQ